MLPVQTLKAVKDRRWVSKGNLNNPAVDPVAYADGEVFHQRAGVAKRRP